MSTQLTKCPNCATENTSYESYCRTCGTMLPPTYQNQQMQPPYNSQMQGAAPAAGADKKMLAGLLAIFLGAFGVHKFILGYNTEGIVMLAVSIIGLIFTCGLATMVVSIIGIVEGIMYLTKSDEEFVQTYINNKKGWF